MDVLKWLFYVVFGAALLWPVVKLVGGDVLLSYQKWRYGPYRPKPSHEAETATDVIGRWIAWHGGEPLGVSESWVGLVDIRFRGRYQEVVMPVVHTLNEYRDRALRGEVPAVCAILIVDLRDCDGQTFELSFHRSIDALDFAIYLNEYEGAKHFPPLPEE